MNIETAELLRRINNDFYREHCASFSSTRHAPWVGWRRCLDAIQQAHPDVFAARRPAPSGEGDDAAACEVAHVGARDRAGEEEGVSRQPFSVFDVACGNLRFERFWLSELPEHDVAFYATDSCDALVREARSSEALSVRYQPFDVLEALMQGESLADAWEAPPCDAVVSFGFMHHVPFVEHRQALLDELIAQTRPGGQVAVSFWQFLNSPELAKKAYSTHRQALLDLNLPPLDEGDYMLGWMNAPGAYRYSHSFSEAEIDSLVASASDKASVAARFSADGRTQNLNSYIVLQVP